jgi:acetylornithine deacetylase/succinyl-diaminopimelate desuccinylase-like protein
MKLEEKILFDLISIDSQTNKNNSEIISYIENQYKNFNLQRQKYIGGDNLIVTIPGKSKKNPLIIAGHTDTINIKGIWETYPFTPKKSDGRIIGLGACDMKGSLACIIALTKNLNLKCEREIYLIFDGSEEDKSQGAKEVSKILPNIKNAIVLIPEPTNREIYLSHGGYFDFYAGDAHIERKLNPKEDAEKEWIETTKNYIDVEIKEGFWNPPYFCDSSRLIKEILKIDSKISISEKPFRGWTEAAIFSIYGPAFIFGAGDYSQAHKPNESIKIIDLEHFSGFLRKMLTYK